jgi:RimJ/RimL family protein N-acetyltransferase
MEQVEISAGRLHLRPWEPGDRAALELALADPDVGRWTTLRPSRAHEMLEAADARWASGTRAELAVLDATTGELLAGVDLHRIEDGEAHVGWWCAREARGRGVTADAVAALCRWGFDAPGLQRLNALVEVGNWASRAVAEKVGFTVEGTLRGIAAPGERRADTWVAGLLPSDGLRDRRRLPSYEDRTDGVVTLRRWRPSDAADVAHACSDAETARWLPVPVPYPVEAGRDYVGTLVPSQWAEGVAANVAVVDAVDGSLLGAVGLKLRDGLGEIGYWTAPWARGRGVAGRACRLHAGWGFSVLGLSRVELLADVDNLASQRAAEKAGWVREGVARAVRPAPRDPGAHRDMVVYARVAGQPE